MKIKIFELPPPRSMCVDHLRRSVRKTNGFVEKSSLSMLYFKTYFENHGHNNSILAWPLTWHQAETCMGALGHAIRKAASPSSSSHALLMLLGISCHLFKQHPAIDSHTQWLATSITF